MSRPKKEKKAVLFVVRRGVKEGMVLDRAVLALLPSGRSLRTRDRQIIGVHQVYDLSPEGWDMRDDCGPYDQSWEGTTVLDSAYVITVSPWHAGLREILGDFFNPHEDLGESLQKLLSLRAEMLDSAPQDSDEEHPQVPFDEVSIWVARLGIPYVIPYEG